MLKIAKFGSIEALWLHWSDVFSNNGRPAVCTIRAWRQQLVTTGSLLKKRRKAKRIISGDKVDELIAALHDNDDERTSTRILAKSLDIPQPTVWRFLREEGFKPWKVQLGHELLQADPHRRLEFCQLQIDLSSVDPTFYHRIWFSDECAVYLNGTLCTQNHRWWAHDNPGYHLERHFSSQKVMVWAALSSQGIVGPYFFDGNVNAERYVRMLSLYFIPNTWRYRLRLPGLPIFQHDGAPAHFSHLARDYLDQQFTDRWMGLYSPTMPWPPRSPDLTPLDFFLWGYLKPLIFRQRVDTLEQLKVRIREAFSTVTQEMCANAIREYERRMVICVARHGRHVEPRL